LLISDIFVAFRLEDIPVVSRQYTVYVPQTRFGRKSTSFAPQIREKWAVSACFNGPMFAEWGT